ncbi:leucine rich repeat protein, partial [gut metagenome]
QPKQDVIVDWGDGVKTTVAKTDSCHLVVSGQVKGKVITVTSQSRITLLLCANNDLTAIDLAAAPNLLSLYCQNNALSTLDVSPCKKLVDLNCSNNKLDKINITSTTNPKLENLNVADNQLGAISSKESAFAIANDNLQHVDISNNRFTRVNLTEHNAKLDGLKASSN